MIINEKLIKIETVLNYIYLAVKTKYLCNLYKLKINSNGAKKLFVFGNICDIL